MNIQSSLFRGLALVAPLLLLAACSKPAAPATTVAPAEGAQIANPASVYCVEKGGKTEAKKDEAGNAIAMCHLPDGTVIEEWELFRRDHPSNG